MSHGHLALSIAANSTGLSSLFSGAQSLASLVGGMLLLAAGPVVVGLLLYGVAWRFFPALRRRKPPALDIQDFDNGGSGLTIGVSLSAAVEDRFHRFADSGSSPLLYLATGTYQQPDSPASVLSAIPQLKLLDPALKWAVRQTGLRLHGWLHPPTERGVGLTVALEDDWRNVMFANHTFWESDFDDDACAEAADHKRYYRLAEMVAIWAQFRIHEEWARGMRRRAGQRFAPMGTTNWRSYAYFRAGVGWAVQGELDKARKMFVQALTEDPGNRGALFNLASLNAQWHEYARAEVRLEQVEKEIEEAEREERASRQDRDSWLRRWLSPRRGQAQEASADDGPCIADPLWYKAQFLLAAIHDYRAMNPAEPSREEQADAAERCAKKLLDTLESSCTLLGTSTLERKCKRFLEEFRSAACLLYAGTLVRLDGDEEPTRALQIVSKIEQGLPAFDGSPRTTRPMRTGATALRSDEVYAYYSHTEMDAGAGDAEMGVAAEVHGDGAGTDASEMESTSGSDDTDEFSVASIETWTGLGYQDEYELACFYAKLVASRWAQRQGRPLVDEYFRKAFLHLEYALERGAPMVKHARTDPSLKCLRDDPSTASWFDCLLNRYGVGGEARSKTETDVSVTSSTQTAGSLANGAK